MLKASFNKSSQMPEHIDNVSKEVGTHRRIKRRAQNKKKLRNRNKCL
jgi:hypothetical protein